MNGILFLELSGIIFWILIIGVLGIELLIKLKAHYFVWNQRRKWVKFYKNKIKQNENSKAKF